MKLLAALSVLVFLAAAAPAVDTGALERCDPRCRPASLRDVHPGGGEVVLERTVIVAPSALPLTRAPMVTLIGMTSSEVRWNGVVIGRNGVPGPTASTERPGRFIARFVVPPQMVRPGPNRVTARLSSQHLWLPVRTPVHEFSIAPYEPYGLESRAYYLPALLALGVLLASMLYFSAAVLADRRNRGAMLLAALAATASLQLLVEVSRAFIDYSYPWHLARVSAIALLSAVTALLLATYAALRFAPRYARAIGVAAGLACATSLLLVPWFDFKALGALLAGIAAAGCAALVGRSSPSAKVALAAAMVALVAMAVDFSLFLDGNWYLLLAALLALLVAEQVLTLKRARDERDAEARRASALAERLARAERNGETIVELKDGNRMWRLAEGDIVAIRAADDYCEAILIDGRTLLVTVGLARLLGSLPACFVRVHKSWAVNRAHVLSSAPRPGGGRQLKLSNGRNVPVGRNFAPALG